LYSFFFFQAEDGIRDPLVTGVQTCASDLVRNLLHPLLNWLRYSLQVSCRSLRRTPWSIPQEHFAPRAMNLPHLRLSYLKRPLREIGRASCRERVSSWGVVGGLNEE